MNQDPEWTIELTRRAQRDLRKIRKDSLPRVRTHLNRLKFEPLAGESLAGTLVGARALHFALPGSGQYRAAYCCDQEERTCVIFAIGTRENFYREAERRWQSLSIDSGFSH